MVGPVVVYDGVLSNEVRDVRGSGGAANGIIEAQKIQVANLMSYQILSRMSASRTALGQRSRDTRSSRTKLYAGAGQDADGTGITSSACP